MLSPGTSRRAILREVIEAETRAHDLLVEAASVAPDPEDRRLFTRLAALDEQELRELQREEDQAESEEFVARAIDV